jgi:hypothetical protein
MCSVSPVIPAESSDARKTTAGATSCGLPMHLAVVTHGMAVHAAGGATRAELRTVARLVLASWPPRG